MRAGLITPSPDSPGHQDHPSSLDLIVKSVARLFQSPRFRPRFGLTLHGHRPASCSYPSSTCLPNKMGNDSRWGNQSSPLGGNYARHSPLKVALHQLLQKQKPNPDPPTLLPLAECPPPPPL